MRAGAPRREGFTLLEMLAVVVILGIAGALVIPAMGTTGVLKVQAAVRTVVADITFAQSDAVAFQEKRAIVFDVPSSSYRLVEVPGDVIDPDTNTVYDPSRPQGLYIVDFIGNRFGDARLTGASFDGANVLIFDAMGGPVSDPGGNTPGSGGTVTITGSGQVFTVTVDAFTGRTSVSSVPAEPSTP